ncbi:hypothetical protein CMI45_01485 [Candidatus Pacearchaeota archaeon]|nr:hypothetical protein [Candidatus Pacearchaeota archaeon]|tara:strand:+ start:1745 stop:1969 length:225 start_codon:yes stop_codon:yes gene_type:complete
MKINNKITFFLGIIWIIFLILAYFIKFDVDSGANYIVKDSLLGILIFHSPIVLTVYILVGILLVLLGIMRIKIK